MNSKIIGIAIAAILIVGGGGAAYLLLNGSDDDGGTIPGETRLDIFGNANNDRCIDQSDVEFLERIIAGEEERTELADANQDGVIDQKDVDFVRRMVDRETMKIYYLNGYGSVKTANYPIKNIIVAGIADVFTMSLCLGAKDKVVGVNGGIAYDPILYQPYLSLPVVSAPMDVISVDIESVSNIMKTTKVDAILTDNMGPEVDGQIANFKQFEDAGIDILRMQITSSGYTTSQVLTTGYLLELEDQTTEYVEFYESVVSDVNEKLAAVTDDRRVTCLSSTMVNYMMGTEAFAYQIIELAGADNIANWPDYKILEGEGDDWIFNYDPDYIVNLDSMGYFDYDVKAMWETYCEIFKDLRAFKEGNVYIVDGTAPSCARIAYLAEIFYPEIFEEGYGDSVHKRFMDAFMPHMSGYDITEHPFVISNKTPGVS